MPGFDGTGPRGQGAMTGAGRGYCAMPVGGVAGQPVRGYFYGRGGGRGRRNCFYATGIPGWMRVQKEDEISILKNQADYLKSELEAIQSRVQDLEGK